MGGGTNFESGSAKHKIIYVTTLLCS
jgi:hypothetical protein